MEMKTGKWIILILLLLCVFARVFLLDPLIRFTLDLRLERFEDAEAVYLARLCNADHAQQEAQAQLTAYAEAHLDRYLAKKESCERVMGLLSALSKTRLPQDSITRCIAAVDEMETARAYLAQADACYCEGAYQQAIPLYRLSMIAENGAAYRLAQAEILYKDQVLEQAEKAMDAKAYSTAESVLLDAQSLLGTDGDLSAALWDVRRSSEQQTYESLLTETRRLLEEEGPAAAFSRMDQLRRQAPQDQTLDYMEQLLRHAYEEDIFSSAQALREAGDLADAYALLENGLGWIDSEAVRTLLTEIGAEIPWLLGELPVLRDDTGPGPTGAQSTVARDRYRADAQSNVYEHSFSADMGSVSFSLQKAYGLFEGTVAFPQGETSDIYRASATLQVFGDGKLMAEFKHMDGSSAPVPFSIPVNGVDELTLSWTSEGANGWKDWGRFATVFDGRLYRSPAVTEAP